MNKQYTENIENYIVPLNMNGLQGRMLRLTAPAGKKRDILLIYGHHSNLERWWGLIQELHEYGSVTVPDLPGFGGMQSLYKLNEKPTLDALSDYLAAFVKLRYKHRKVSLVGVSFGFVVITRMLQRYPDLTKRVELLVSLAGFAHHDDFIMDKGQLWWYRLGALVLSRRTPAWFFKQGLLRPFMLEQVYAHGAVAIRETAGRPRRPLDYDVKLWRQNDVRTHMATLASMLAVDNCQVPVALPVWHVGMKNDGYINNQIVEQHLRVIFSHYHQAFAKGSVYDLQTANAPDAAKILPGRLRRKLARQ